jgi:osmotically-inducible protein OsmY
MKNDALLQQEVIAALAIDPALRPDSVGVEVHHGFVKLAGRVNTLVHRLNAEKIAKRVQGVKGVNMDIDVVTSVP